MKVEAKPIVLERIFREHKLSGPEVATFGDGPVEMRETRGAAESPSAWPATRFAASA